MLKLRLLSFLCISTLTFLAAPAQATTFYGCYAMMYSATWCGPCHKLKKVIDGRDECVPITKVTMDKFPEEYCNELIENVGLTTYPTIVIYRHEYNDQDGQGSEVEIARFEGLGVTNGQQNENLEAVNRIMNSEQCVMPTTQVRNDPSNSDEVLPDHIVSPTDTLAQSNESEQTFVDYSLADG